MTDSTQCRKLNAGTHHCQLDGVKFLTTAVYDPTSESIIGLYVPKEGKVDQIGVWSLKGGNVSKTHTVVALPKGLEPRYMDVVQLAGKPRAVFINEKFADTCKLWQVDIANNPKPVEVDTSKIRNPKNELSGLASYKDLLFVFTDDSLPIHVYKDLKYHRDISIPYQENAVIVGFSFSEKYVVTSSKGKHESEIRAYSWCPEKLTVSEMVFGPVPGCYLGSHLQLAPQYILTNISLGEGREKLGENFERQRLAIYDLKDNTNTNFELQESRTEPLVRITENSGKVLLFLRTGSVFELKEK